MTPQQRKEITRYLKAFDFSGLFTDPSVGWDWPDSRSKLLVPFGSGFIELHVIAEKRGVKVLHVPPMTERGILVSEERKKLEKAVTPLAAEHLLIFTDKPKTRQVWLWTSRLPGKPVRHRELTWEQGRSNELLLQKLSTIAFTLNEEDALDITGVVQRLRDSLDRDKLTKKFYTEFKSQKDRFQKFIKGISDSGILAHYTSLMLNRLMFCYFLQQKGFLNGEQDYLRKRLETVPATLGKNQFHSFYRSFLKRLFFDGLDGEARPDELTALIGKNIPYLNGGIFAEHPIERAHPDIVIKDEAFEKIFDFFDAYHWHLDDRPLGNDREINPEVLGYVFEKYTNQKEMGAYYTKEDITEYISKNTILPFLLQKVAGKLPADAWDLLKNDPDRYIYEPVRRSAGADEKAWKKSLPANIATGLDTKAPDLLERRKHWNTSTPASHALPTEIWRETIARHQRCHELRKKLRAGEVREAADLVTLNLDIRQFVQDIIAAAPADLALAMCEALRSLSVLDPTCGSGAFLFAALEILEPLYEGLLERFRALLADWQGSGEKHPVWEKEIRQILDAVERHPNEAYFIHKTIIVHNLYGVDIMEEAVEICKLRLFLKLAAQLEPGQNIEPLPDIDFNVRSGNTLVGYASKAEIHKAFTESRGGRGGEQMALLGIENSLDDYRRIMEQAEDADRAFKRFQDLQDTIGQASGDFRSAKQRLETVLKSLRFQLDRFLAGEYDQKNLKSDASFAKWRASHEPFHWFVEFYGIMNTGGFDVIVGNPPYVEYSRSKIGYAIYSKECATCDNLWAFCLERSSNLLSPQGDISLIVPLSLASTERFSPALNLLRQRFKCRLLTLSGDAHPSVLFDGVKMSYTILVASRCSSPVTYVSKLYRWLANERPFLFACLEFLESRFHPDLNLPFKIGNQEHRRIIERICKNKIQVRNLERRGGDAIYYHRIVRHFVKSFSRAPYFRNDRDGEKRSDDYKILGLSDFNYGLTIRAFLMSSIYYLFFVSLSDAYHCGRDLVLFFPVWNKPPDPKITQALIERGTALEEDIFGKSVRRKIVYKTTGLIEYDEFYPRHSKALADQIDAILAEHYGFTEEELDFIINYDIKYRMGLAGGDGEEAEDE